MRGVDVIRHIEDGQEVALVGVYHAAHVKFDGTERTAVKAAKREAWWLPEKLVIVSGKTEDVIKNEERWVCQTWYAISKSEKTAERALESRNLRWEISK